MNKIFKTVWSDVHHTYVAVSEITKSNGKKSGGSLAKPIRAMVVAAVLTCGLFAMPDALAEDTVGYTAGTTHAHNYVARGAGGTLRGAGVDASHILTQHIYIDANDNILVNQDGSYWNGTGTVPNYYLDNQGNRQQFGAAGAAAKPDSTGTYGYTWDSTTNHWVRDGYTLNILSTNSPRTGLNAAFGNLGSNQSLMDAVWTGNGAPPSDILYTTTSAVSSVPQTAGSTTPLQTNLNESLQQVTASNYGAMSNGGTNVEKNWGYIIYDPTGYGTTLANTTDRRDGKNWPLASNGYADVGEGKGTDSFPRGFKRAGQGEGLEWDSSRQCYVYTNPTTGIATSVSNNEIYVLSGTIGVFTNQDGSLYTGSVYGGNNTLLMTTAVRNADGTHTFYSYWGDAISDSAATMANYPVSSYNADIQTLVGNDTALAHNDINHVSVTGQSTSVTIAAYRNGTDMQGTENNTNLVPGSSIRIQASGGTGGVGNGQGSNDRKFAIYSGTSTNPVHEFNMGSRVGAPNNLNGNNLESLTINGTQYGLQTIYQGDDGQNVVRNLSRSLKLTGGVGTTGTGSLVTNQNNIGVTKGNGTDDTLRISLNKDINLTSDGSLTIGNTVVNNTGLTVTTSATDSTQNPSITASGISGGSKQITNVASGGSTGTNAANISDVHSIAKSDVQTEAGKNLSKEQTFNGDVRTDRIYLNDDITLGSGTNTVHINGNEGTLSLGTSDAADRYISFNGTTGVANIGGIVLGGEGTESNDFITGLDNTTWNPSAGITSGRAATEDQLAAAMPHYFSISSSQDGSDAGTQYGNYWNNGATGDHAMAIGHNVTAAGEHSIAIGDGGLDPSTQTNAKGKETLAVGYQTTAEGDRSIAIGNKNKANGIRSVSLGMDVQAGYTSPAANVESDSYEDGTMTGGADIAVGNRTRVYGTGSTAIGFGAKVGESKFTTTTTGGVTTTTESMDTGADMAMALGGRSQAMVDGGVALGNLSYANRAAGSVGTNTAAGDTATTVYLDPSGTTGNVNMGTLKATFDENGNVIQAGSTDNLQAGTAWRANMGAISIGGDARTGTTASGHTYTLPKITRQLTGLAAGSQDTDAVNVAQLKALASQGLNFQGNNTDTTVHTDAGDTLKIQGTNHNIQVTGNGTVKGLSIALDSTVDVNTLNAGSYSNSNNVQGTINLVGQNRQGAYKAAKITAEEGGGTTNANRALDGTTTQRLQYVEDTAAAASTTAAPATHTLATLEDDGLKFAGDTGSANVKLDKQVNVKGNATDLSGSNNIGVAATSDENGNATLTLRLAKDVTGLNSVTAGTNARFGNTEAGTLQLKDKTGTDQSGQFAASGDYVTGLDNTDWDVDSPTYVSGRAATEDELNTVTGQVSQNKTDIAGHETRISNVEKGWNLKADGEEGSANIQAGDTVTLNTVADTNSGDDAVNNLSVTRGGTDGKTVSFSLNKDITLGTSSGTDTGGKLTVNSGRSGTSDTRKRYVEIDGNDVKVVQDDSVRAKLSTSEYGGYLELGGGYLPSSTTPGGTVRLYRSEDKDSTGISRLAYVTVNSDGTFSGNRNTLATLSDGIAVSGDTTVDSSGTDTSANGNKVKLNKKLAVNGDDNITTTSTAEADDGVSVKVALKPALTGINSISGNGSTISLTNSGISLGAITGSDGNVISTVNVNNQKITGVAPGTLSATSTDAVNGSQLQAVKTTAELGWEARVNGSKLKDVNSASRVLNFYAAPGNRNPYTDNIVLLKGSYDSTGNSAILFGTKADVNYRTVRVGGTRGTQSSDANGNPTTPYTGGILIGNQADGTSTTATGNYITGLDNKTWVIGTTTPVDGRAATENQLKSVSDEVDTLKNGWNLALNDGTGSDAARAVKTGQTVTFDNKQTSNNRGNIQISRSTDASGNQTVSLGLNKDLQLGSATGGTNNGGSIRVNKGTESAHISITGDSVKLLAADADTLTNERVTLGYDTTDGGYITLGGGGTGNNGHMRLFKNTDNDGTGMARLAYVDPESDMNPSDYHTLATLDDGTTYAGDTGTDTKVALNKKVTVTGAASDADKNDSTKWTTGNISVSTEATTTDGNADGNAKLTISMKKNLDGIQSVGQNGNTITFGDTAGSGITLNGGSMDVGGNKITNIADGSANSDAVNYGQLSNAAAGWDVQTNGTALKTVSTAKDSTDRTLNFVQGDNMAVSGSGSNITIATNPTVGFTTVHVAGTGTGSNVTDGIILGTQSGMKQKGFVYRERTNKADGSYDITTYTPTVDAEGYITADTGTKVTSHYNAAGTLTSSDPGETYSTSQTASEGKYITGLTNTGWTRGQYVSGRAATEDQLASVAQQIRGEVSASDNFTTGGAITYEKTGEGTLSLEMNNQSATQPSISGFHDFAISDAHLDGNTLTLARNDASKGTNGAYQEADKGTKWWTVDLSGLVTPDMHLVGAGTDQNGAYTADENGDIHLTVTDGQEGADHTKTITISGLATNFGANSSQYKVNSTDENYSDTHKVAVGQTQKIIGSAAQADHTYSDTNITTELDADGNIHILMDANPTIQSVTFSKGGDSTTLNLANDADQLYYSTDGGTTKKYLATTDEDVSFQGNNTGVTIFKKLSDTTPLKIVGDAASGDVATGNNVYVTGSNDGSLKIQLGQNLGGFTTIQAGTDLKIGTQTNGSNSDTGDYITGLDNTTWNGTAVTGRAATEDQLKAVADSVTKDVTGKDRYISGATFSDGDKGAIDGTFTVANGTDVKTTGLHDYYVTGGEVTTVTEPVEGGEATTKSVIRLTKNDGKTVDVDISSLVSTDYQLVGSGDDHTGAYTVGDDGTLTLNVYDPKTKDTKQVQLTGLVSQTQVAKGMNFGANDGTAHNVKLGGTQKVMGRTLADGESVSETAGSNTFSTKNVTTTMNEGGDIVINLADNPQLQSVILNGAGSSQTITLQAGDDNRLTYTVGGSTKKVATTDDGMSYVGDNSAEVDGVLTNKLDKKLTETLAIKGGADPTNLSDKNIGVTIADDQINVKLAKDVTGLNTVTAGSTADGKTGVVVGWQDDKGTPSASGTGYEKGNFITGLSNTSWNPLEDPVDGGRAATEDQVKAVEQQVTYAYKHNGKTETTEDNPYGGFGLTGDNDVTAKQDIGKAITVKGGSNISTSADKDNKSLTIGLSQNLTNMQSATFDQPTEDNNSSTVINGGGVTITPKKGGTAVTGNDVISLGTTGLSNGNNQIKYVASGVGITSDDTAEKKLNKIQNASGDDLKNAVNVGDLQAAVGGAVSSMNLNFQGNNGATISRGDDATLKIQGSGVETLPGYENSDNKGWGAENIRVEADATNGTLTINTAKDFHVDTLRAGTAGNVANDRAGHIQISGPSANTAGTYEYVDITSGYNAQSVETYATNPAGRSDTPAITRLHYQNMDNNGNLVDKTGHTVATLDDGFYLSGDLVNGSVPATDALGLGIGLNRKVTFTGGAADNLTAASDKNIGVTVTQDGNGNTTFNLLLNKDLSGLNTVTAGGVKVGTQDNVVHTLPNGTEGNPEKGSFVTGLSNTTWDPATTGYVKGRAATEDQLKAVQDSVNQKVDQGTWGFTTDDSQKITTTMNKEIAISGEKRTLPTEQEVVMTRGGVNMTTTAMPKSSTRNITTAVDADNQTLLLQLSNQLALGNETGSAATDGGRIDLYAKREDPSGKTGSDTSYGNDHSRIHISAADGISLRHTDGNDNTKEQLDGVSIVGPYNYNIYDKAGNLIKGSDGNRLNYADSNGSIAITNDEGKFTARLSDIGATGYLGLGNTYSTLHSNPGITDAEQIQSITTTVTDKDGHVTSSTQTGTNVARIAMYTHYGAASLNKDANVKEGVVSQTTDADGNTTTVTYSNIQGRYDGKGAMTRLKYLDEEGFSDDGSVTGKGSHTLATLDDGIIVSADSDLGDGAGNYSGSETKNERSLFLNNKLQFTGNSTVDQANALRSSGGMNITGSANVGIAVYDSMNEVGKKNILIALQQDQKGFNTIQVGGVTDKVNQGSNAPSDAANPQTIRIGNLADSSNANVGLTLADSAKLNTVSTTGQAVAAPLYEATDDNGHTYYTSDASDSHLTKLYRQENNGYSKNKTDLGVLNDRDGSPYKIEYGTYWSEVKAGDAASAAVIYQAQDGNGKTYYTTDVNDSHIVMVNGEKQQAMATLNAPTGRYMTGLSNTAWDGQSAHIVTDRAATEGQLRTAEQQVTTYNAYNEATQVGGGFALAADQAAADGGSATVTQNLGGTITIQGDANDDNPGNIVTTADNDGKSITIGLNDHLSLGTMPSAPGGDDGTPGSLEMSNETGDQTIYIDGSGRGSIRVGREDTGIQIGTQDSAEGDQNGSVQSVTGLGNKTWDANHITSGRAATEDQLQQAAKSIQNNVGQGMNFQGDAMDSFVNRRLGETMRFTGGETDASQLTTADDRNIGVTIGADDELQIRLAKNLSGLTSVTTGGTTMDTTGVTVKNGDTSSKLTENSLSVGNKTYIDGNGLNANSQKITGVAEGVADTDAVNMGQLKEMKAQAESTVSGSSNITVTPKEQADGHTNYQVALNDHVTLGNEENKVDIDGTKGTITTGDVTISKDGVKTGDVELSKDGIKAGNKQITGVASGLGGRKLTDLKDGDKELTNAANIGDLKEATQEINTNIQNVTNDVTNINKKLAGGMNFQGDDKQNVNQAMNGTLTIMGGENDTAKLTTMGDRNIGVISNGSTLEVRLAKDLKGLSSTTYTTATGEGDKASSNDTVVNGNGISIRNGSGSDAKEAVGLSKTGLSIAAPTTPADAANAAAITRGAITISQETFEVQKNDKGEVVKDKDGKATYIKSGGGISLGGNQVKEIASGITGQKYAVDPQNPATANLNNAASVGDLNTMANVINNNTQNAITNVSRSVNKLSNRVDKVGAGAAALAALHPTDFDPDDKWDFAAGYGHYKDANAAALGVYYRPNEDTMFSIGGSMGGGENMLNAGVSFKLGQGNHVTNSRVAMAKQITAMQTKMDAMAKEIESLKAGGAPAKATSQSKDTAFPDIPENHWAYEYVHTLADKGLLEGYPDGDFKGDRTMTRYEFAAIIYRALQNGAAVDGTMARSVDEFESEIADVQKAYRFRVDRVAGGDNDRHKIERVRVNDKDDPATGDYRDVYGGKIQKPEAPAAPEA